jgi:hypothetical protein
VTTYTRRQLRATMRQALEQLALQHGTGPLVDRCHAALGLLDGEPPDRRELVWRRFVQPGLWVVVEDSLNVLLELTTPDEREVLARTGPLSGSELADDIALARAAVADLEERAEQARLASLRERLAERRKT